MLDSDSETETLTPTAHPSSSATDVLADICKDKDMKVRGVAVIDVQVVFCSVRVDGPSHVVDFSFDPLPTLKKDLHGGPAVFRIQRKYLTFSSDPPKQTYEVGHEGAVTVV